MTLNEVKILLVGTIKQAFTNKKILDKFSENEDGKLLYNNSEISSSTSVDCLTNGEVVEMVNKIWGE